MTAMLFMVSLHSAILDKIFSLCGIFNFFLAFGRKPIELCDYVSNDLTGLKNRPKARKKMKIPKTEKFSFKIAECSDTINIIAVILKQKSRLFIN